MSILTTSLKYIKNRSKNVKNKSFIAQAKINTSKSDFINFLKYFRSYISSKLRSNYYSGQPLKFWKI